jgi:hypothetical protein
MVAEEQVSAAADKLLSQAGSNIDCLDQLAELSRRWVAKSSMKL